MLNTEEQNIVDILEDSELDFKWQKSISSNSLYIHVNMDLGSINHSNDLAKIIWDNVEYRQDMCKLLNKEHPLILRIKYLTGYVMGDCKVRWGPIPYLGGSVSRVGISLTFSKESNEIKTIQYL